MRPYEMMIVLAPDIPEDELDPTIDTIEDYVTRFEGDVIAINRDSPWGRRRLAYPIRHQGRDVRDGFYALYYFDAPPTAITEIEREIRLNDRIIRHMIIALEEQVTILPPVEPEGDAEGEAPAADGEAPVVEAAVEETATAEVDEPVAEAATEEPAAEEVAEEAVADEAEADADEAPAAEEVESAEETKAEKSEE